jgi:signal transduction histidine kinase
MDHSDVIERTAALVTTLDGADRILLFNSRCEEAFRIGREASRGRSWLELCVRLEDRRAAAERLGAVRGGEVVGPFAACVPVDSDAGAPRCIRWHLTLLEPDIVCATGIDVTGEEEAAVRCRRDERIAALGTMTAGLAHELRNPLNAAHLQLDLARRRLARNGELNGALHAVEVASAEVTRLGRLVDEFLVFARPGALQLARGDLRLLVEATVDQLRAEAAARSIEVVVEAAESVYAEFDDVRMTQALHHLLRNAIEATGGGGVVRVAVRAAGGRATFLVEDSGPGLPAGAPVFEPFYTTKANGTGLGLAIAHRIACDHGGSIAVDSSPGRTRFALSVPAL